MPTADRTPLAVSPGRRTGHTRRLALATTILTLVLVAVGGYTRGSGSGYGCEDRWPLCENGHLGGVIPRWDYNMIVEWTHRWVAATVGLLAVATAVSAWRHHRDRRGVPAPAAASVAVIGLQAWVGRMVVTRDLDADLVSLHLAISMMVLALVTVTAVNSRASAPEPTGQSDPGWSRLLALGATGAIVVLLLGSYVHNLYISGWPLVGNTLLPSFTSRYITVHFAHRVAAGVVLILLVGLARHAVTRRRPAAERRLIVGAATAFATNVLLGAGHVVTEVGSSLLVAGHLLLAGVVWALLVAATAMAATAA